MPRLHVSPLLITVQYINNNSRPKKLLLTTKFLPRWEGHETPSSAWLKLTGMASHRWLRQEIGFILAMPLYFPFLWQSDSHGNYDCTRTKGGMRMHPTGSFMPVHVSRGLPRLEGAKGESYWSIGRNCATCDGARWICPTCKLHFHPLESHDSTPNRGEPC